MPAQPTAWLAEGLLPYLPGDAQDRLFDLVTAHSAAGSRIAVEAFNLHPSQYSSGKAGGSGGNAPPSCASASGWTSTWTP